jgi:hypothetical protein
MNGNLGRRLIALIICVQLLAAATWAVLPKCSSGPPGGAYSFRAHERMIALSDWVRNPSPTTETVWESELALLRKHNLVTREIPAVALVLLINGGIIYALWNYRTTRQTA